MMFCKKCGAKLEDDARYCPSCGCEVKRSVEQTQKDKLNQKYEKNKKIGKIVVPIFLLVVVAVLIYFPKQTLPVGYGSLDRSQATEEHLEEIAEYMDDKLEELGYFPVGYSVEWIGYSKYKDLYSEEEYETDMQTGGYYSYTGQLSTGEIALASVATYWGDNEEPNILNLSIELDLNETVIVEFSNEKMTECWNTYHSKAKLES